MDPIKQSLMDTANITDEMEQRVHENVRKNLQKRKFHIPIWIPSLIVVASSLFFLFNFLGKEQEKAAFPSDLLTQSDYEFLRELLNSRSTSDPDSFDFQYTATIALPLVAKRSDVKIDRKEYELSLASQIEELKETTTYQINKQDEFFKKVYDIYVPLMIESQLYEEQLLENMSKEYPSFLKETLRQMLNFSVIERFMEYPEANYFATKQELENILYVTNHSEFLTITHVIDDYAIAVANGNFFNLHELSPEQIESFEEKIYKIPHILTSYAQVGQSIEVSYWQEFESRGIQEIVPKTIHAEKKTGFTLNEEDEESVASLLNELEWKTFMSIDERPLEIGFFLNDNSYLIKMNEDFTNMIIYNFTTNEKASFSTEQEPILISYLKNAVVNWTN